MGSKPRQRDGVSVMAAVFVLIFTFCHLMSASNKKEAIDRGYFATLTVFTLLLTCFVIVTPAPPCLTAAVVSINLLVTAIYYSLINVSFVKPTSYLLHGGVATILFLLIFSGRISCSGSPMASGLIAGILLAMNAVLQLRYEKRTKQLLYPSCANFTHPIWRLVFLPMVGAFAAAWIAASSLSNV